LLKKEGMAKKTMVVDGYIGPYAYSKQFIRQMLENSGEDEIELIVSSLGGRVDHALDIHDQLAQHGNVTVKYTGFNASAATFLSLGAKNIRISENSFYLIHKVSIGIDLYGAYNEDGIDVLIGQLQKEKDENKKMDMRIAVMYAKKSGKTIRDILDLMKKDTWLTAEEALDFGFVDEVFTASKQENLLEDKIKVAMITTSGLPSPLRLSGADPVTLPQMDEESFFQKIWARFTNRRGLEERENSHNNTFEMKKQYLNVNKVLDVEKLEGEAQGVYLNESQVESLDQRLASDAANLQTALSERDDAVTQKEAAISGLGIAMAAFDAIDETITNANSTEEKVNAIRALLAAKPGVAASGTLENQDSDLTDSIGVDQATIDNLPHNKEVDRNL
jgi:ATP-dependent Clp protease, protease subunit